MSLSNRYFTRLLLLLFMPVLLTVPVITLAQEHEEENHTEVIYKRPDYKEYRSLSYALSQPDSVYILVLKGKKLKEFPMEVSKLPNLKVLDLSRNKIKVIPDSLQLLAGLEELDLSSNKIEELPESIGEMVSLKKLSLNRNVIVNLPASIGKLKSLQILELWDNELDNLPDEIHDLKNLKKLELRGILFSEEQQKHFHDLLPDTEIYMSPSCNCKIY